ncbi:hypothetical protein EYR36_000775 [Pleurotus pulmonarius]|nr:hypothetical protein EYR36_000775 [Pleurotus pulmonarius]
MSSEEHQLEGASAGVPSSAAAEEHDTIVADDSGIPETWTELQFSWSGKPFSLKVADSDRHVSIVFDLKATLYSMTDVPPERQKILGLVKGKLPPEEARISDLRFSGKKFTLVGTPEGHEIKDPSQMGNLPDLINDLDVELTDAALEAYKRDRRNARKIREATEKLNVNIIFPLRPGKRLLVLDIDYTILDTKPLTTGSLPPAECARPKLHEFLEAVYPHYDSESQTSWIWLETKLVELQMIGSNKNYQISFVLDKTAMFKVFTVRDGKPWDHSVKALQIIWNRFPQFDASNTIHIDDLSRNFALNPGSGLKISAFKDAHTPAAMADRELEKLSRYLVHIAGVPDFRALRHNDWKKTLRQLPPP